jgi:hypothetical protein
MTGWGLVFGQGDCHPCYPQSSVNDHSWDDGVCIDCGVEWDNVPDATCRTHTWDPSPFGGHCLDCGAEWEGPES